MRDYAQFLRAIASQVLEARLSTGAGVLDAIDVREWLIELAEKAEQAETIETVQGTSPSRTGPFG